MKTVESFLDGTSYKRRAASSASTKLKEMIKVVDKLKDIKMKRALIYQDVNSCLQIIDRIEWDTLEEHEKFIICNDISNAYIILENSINRAIEDIYCSTTNTFDEERANI